jgi:hypothetical protein
MRNWVRGTDIYYVCGTRGLSSFSVPFKPERKLRGRRKRRRNRTEIFSSCHHLHLRRRQHDFNLSWQARHLLSTTLQSVSLLVGSFVAGLPDLSTRFRQTFFCFSLLPFIPTPRNSFPNNAYLCHPCSCWSFLLGLAARRALKKFNVTRV